MIAGDLKLTIKDKKTLKLLKAIEMAEGQRNLPATFRLILTEWFSDLEEDRTKRVEEALLFLTRSQNDTDDIMKDFDLKSKIV